MELTDELKKRIDDYFNNVSPEELYDILVNKYGFEEVTTEEFKTVEQKFYTSIKDNIDTGLVNTTPLAA